MSRADRDGATVATHAPGRVNLIGDHTDYMGGLALPMAVDLGTTVRGRVGGTRLRLRSEGFEDVLDVELPVTDPAVVTPTWGRYAAGVAAELGTRRGLDGTVTSTVPAGGGLSSSAALEVAVALALGAPDDPVELADLCRRAETAATGVPCGIMDQLCSVAGVAGHALLIDCATLEVTPVRIPDEAAIWVVDPGEPRALAGSAYAERRATCEAAAEVVGPLPHADMSAIESLDDPVLRARARHVRTECDRVRGAAAALTAGDLVRAGELMVESHRSLAEDFEVSTPGLDRAVEELMGLLGVYGARLTGAGFGGNVVALARPDAVLPGRRVRPSEGARLL
ncbi:MAG: galactokinase [Microthrixaceae bacterium]